MKLNSLEKNAILLLKNSSEFDVLINTLIKEQKRTDEALRVASPELFQRTQGRSLFIAELLHDVASHREY